METREPLAADRLATVVDGELPPRLRLVRDLDVFEMPDGLGVHFRGGTSPVIVRGQRAREALEYLLPRLADPHDVADLLRTRPTALTSDVVRRTLSLLWRKGLLIDATASEPGSGRDVGAIAERQSLLFDRALGGTASDGDAAQRALGTARVALVGTGMFGAAVRDLLARSGCGEISALAWDDDGVFGAAAAPGHARERSHRATTSVPEAEHVVRAWCDDADLLVTATRRAPDALFEALNGVCLERGGPRWLRADDDGSDYRIGPVVDPFESACFTCLRLRRTSAHPFAIEENLYQRRLGEERTAGSGALRGEALAGVALAASIVCLEVVRILTGVAPPTLQDAELVVAPLEGSIRRHRFLRVPRCPACGSGRPRPA